MYMYIYIYIYIYICICICIHTHTPHVCVCVSESFNSSSMGLVMSLQSCNLNCYNSLYTNFHGRHNDALSILHNLDPQIKK